MTQRGEDLVLGDFVAILRRRWLWFVAPMLAVVAAAYFLTANQTETFDASARVLLSDSAAQDAVGNGSQSTSFRSRILENEISLAVSDQAVTELAKKLNVSVDDVPSYSVRADSDSDLLVFSTSQRSAERAATVANATAETYVALKQQQASDSITVAVTRLEATLVELETERADVRADLVSLQEDLTQATEETRPTVEALIESEASRISGRVTLIDAQIAANADSITLLELSGNLALGGTARIVSVANPPSSNSNAPLSRNLVLGVLAGAILGTAAALTRDNLDDKVRSSKDLEQLGLVSLGEIPKASRRENLRSNLARVSQLDSDSPQAQAHQKTQTAIRFLATQHNISSVLITSASQGEGKTTLASNLAIAMSNATVRTVLVDVDLRRPRIHKAWDIPQEPGFTSVVADDLHLVESATLIGDADSHLAVLPAGRLPSHPASFISTPSFTNSLQELAKHSDFSVFDAPPILPVADSLTLAQMVDGVILVAFANQTKSEDLATAAESLHSSGANLLGAVLLGAAHSTSGYDYSSSSDDLLRM